MEAFPWTLRQKTAAGAHLCLRYGLSYMTADADSRHSYTPKRGRLSIKVENEPGGRDETRQHVSLDLVACVKAITSLLRPSQTNYLARYMATPNAPV
jgi:hypothetical protein